MKILFILVILAVPLSTAAQKVVKYDLTIGHKMVNYSGKKSHGIAINGQIPAPTLEFTEGDIAEINVYNSLDEESSLHWHGLLLPNEQDGVPYLTTTPIKPKGTHQFRFPIRQSGTYWYHSHSNLQEQKGLYGAFIIKKREEPDIPNYTLLLSDWTDEHPHEVMRSLKNENDWYAIKKNAVQSYGEAAKAGAIKEKLKQEWSRMDAMDVSDVYYNAMLANGKLNDHADHFRPGEKIRLRIINGSASTYFWVQFAGGKMSVAASDGMDVEPVEVDRLIIAVAETFDVLVTIPDDGAYELRATAEDRTIATSLWLGKGPQVKAPVLPRLKLFEGMKMMNEMGKHKMKMSYQQMDMNEVMYQEMTPDPNNPDIPFEPPVTLNYAMLRSPVKTSLDPEAPVRKLNFRLTGSMNRYQWSINDKPLSKTDKILIKKGEVVRITISNETMMRHPMHLHGHFFRVLNGQGEYSPLKNVMDVMPMEENVIEFDANEEKDWFFHCHILYHMMAGMGRVFSYQDSPPNTQIAPTKANWNFFKNEDARMWHPTTNIMMQSNGVFGHAFTSNNDTFFSGEFHYNPKFGGDIELKYGHFVGKMQFLNIYGGTRLHHEKENGRWKTKLDGLAGLEYTLPMFVRADLRVDTRGKFRLQLEREDIAVSRRLRFDAMWNTDKEYQLGMRYLVSKRWQIGTNYFNRYGFGAGVVFSY